MKPKTSDWVKREIKAAERPLDAKARTQARVKKRAANRMEKFLKAIEEDRAQAQAPEEEGSEE